MTYVQEKKRTPHLADKLTDTCGVARKRKTDLRFSHHLAARSDPNDENELLALRFFVVGVSDACVAVRGLGVIEGVPELSESMCACLCDYELV